MPAIVVTPNNIAYDAMKVAVGEALGIAGEASNAQVNEFWRARMEQFIHRYLVKAAANNAGGAVPVPVVT